MEKILHEILTEDKSLLGRRDELIAALDKKVPGNLKRDFTPIRKAISLNVGEKFLTGDNNKDATKEEVREILKASGMQAARIEFVIETFIKALDWDKPKAMVVLEKVIDKKPTVESVSMTELYEKAKKESVQLAKPPAPIQPPPEQKVSPPKPTAPPEQKVPPPKPTTPPVQTDVNKNKKIFIGMTCAVLLLLVVAGSNKQNTNTSTNHNPVAQISTFTPSVEDKSYLDAKTDLSLNGLDLGISVAEAERELGKPKKIEYVEGYDRYIYNDKFHIDVQDDKVIYIISNDSQFKTLRGLHVGSTYGEVVEKYGTNSSDMVADGLNLHEYEFISLDGERGLLRFAINNSGRVDYISVRITEPPALGINWIKDAHGVYLWNPQPTEGETITWSGGFVKDGQYKFADGNGVVTWYNKYGKVVQVDEGNFKHGQRHGQFTHRFKNGNVVQIKYDNGVEIKEEPKSDIDENVKQAAIAFVNYHKAITNGNFSAAFNLFTDERKADMNYNVQAFAKGYSDTITSEITDLQLVSNSGNRVVMSYILDARDRAKGGKTLYQQFKGQVEMVKVGGEWKIASTESKRIKEVMER